MTFDQAIQSITDPDIDRSAFRDRMANPYFTTMLDSLAFALAETLSNATTADQQHVMLCQALHAAFAAGMETNRLMSVASATETENQTNG